MSAMASYIRRALHSYIGFSSTRERRCFSQFMPRWELGGRRVQGARPPQSAERSLRVMSKELSVMPTDIGLLEGTFVTPTLRNVPSIFKSPREFLKLQFTRVRLHARDYFSLLIIKFSSPKVNRWYSRQLQINRRQTAPTAIALHREMYNAFADGNARDLRNICADGIYESLTARIGSRVRGEKVVWELVRYNKRPSVVSHRAARFPIDGSGIRQAVVRICSTQKLTRYAANGSVVNGTGKEKSVIENVVIQKKFTHWKDGEWQIWGTTEETTLNDVRAWEAKTLGA